MNGEPSPLADLGAIEAALLGRPNLTGHQVAERAGLAHALAQELRQQLGFPRAAADDVAFSDADVEALRRPAGLIDTGVLADDSRAALVRTWGRSYARPAAWQAGLLAGIAAESDDPEAALAELVDVVLPDVEALQAYVWRRHLLGAAGRLVDQGVGDRAPMGVGFVDIVGFTSRSKQLEQDDLVDWVETFESFLARTAVEIALVATERGLDADAPFPSVRAGVAYGDVATRLGDVLGPTVDIAARLVSLARPDTVVVDRGAYTALKDNEPGDPAPDHEPDEVLLSLTRIIQRAGEELAELSPYSVSGDYRLRRLPRMSVTGHSRLQPWAVRRAGGSSR